ncbi:MAG: aminoacyltransferase [Erysipelothrix sp.]|nr:aminoacyltransferase [Erysipelothrix sp.]
MLVFSSQLDIHEYDAFASKHPYSTLLQSGAWPKIKKNWKPFYTGVYQDNQLVATALVLIRGLPMGFKFAYIPRGPLMDYSDQEVVTFFLNNLKTLAKQMKCLFVRMDPAVCYKRYSFDNKDTAQPLEEGLVAINSLIQAEAKHLGLPLKMHDSFQPRFVAITTLQDQLVKTFPTKTQQAIKYANKRKVIIEQGSYELLDDFVSMIEKTEDRKNINLRDKTYFTLFLDNYKDDATIYLALINPKENYEAFSKEIQSRQDELERILDKSPKKARDLQEQIASFVKLRDEIEEHKDQTRIVIASMLTVSYGQIVELLYAGTDIKYSRFYPQEAIYATVMEQAQQAGLNYCTMGGIEGSLEDGLTLFKSKFNPLINEYIGEFDVPTSKLYKGFMLAWNLRTTLRERKQKNRN